jgi:DNA-binding XRE family transcriptional regulator
MAKPTQGAVRLRAWMARTDTTQEQIAEQIEASQQSVSAWLAGRQEPKLRHALALKRLAKIAVEDWTVPAAESGASLEPQAKSA